MPFRNSSSRSSWTYNRDSGDGNEMEQLEMEVGMEMEVVGNGGGVFFFLSFF